MTKNNEEELLVIEYFDNICKGIEGIKDKYNQLFQENQKNEKLDNLLKQMVLSIKQLIEDKHKEIFKVDYIDDEFSKKMTIWIEKYNKNNDLIMNIKLLHRNLDYIKKNIKMRIISSDPLCFSNLTDSLILKNKKNK